MIPYCNRKDIIWKEKDCVYEKDGAIWYKATQYGGEKDEVLIIINQNNEEASKVDKMPDNDFIAQISIDITEIFKSHIQVGWEQNITIQNRISQNIDDLFYEYEKSRGFKVSFDLIDKIIENSKTVAMRRF